MGLLLVYRPLRRRLRRLNDVVEGSFQPVPSPVDPGFDGRHGHARFITDALNGRTIYEAAHK